MRVSGTLSMQKKARFFQGIWGCAGVRSARTVAEEGRWGTVPCMASLAAALMLAAGQVRAQSMDQARGPEEGGVVVPDEDGTDTEKTGKNPTTLDAVSVKATSLATKDAVASKRSSAVTVDSLDEDSIQVHTQEDSIAQKLLAAPGVSLMRDEDQPRYISARGIEPNLNSTTLDGISMASVGDEGGGERKINLQLIPNDLVGRVDLYKTFSAEQNPDSIGAGISLVSGSAFDRPRHSLHLDASANYHDLGNDGGANSQPETTSRWGNGLNGRYSTTFGSADQFGLTVSARRQEFQTSQNKLFQSSQYFYDTNGNNISGPNVAGWNGMSAPYNFAYYADNRWIKSYGGSAKLEWWPTDSPLRASVMVYSYGMEERRTENGYEFTSERSIHDQTPTSGTYDIASLNVIFQNNVWARNNRGVLTGLEWSEGDQWLALRAGYTRDRINKSSKSVRLTADPGDGQQLDYASSGVGEIYNIASIANPGILYGSTYALNSASVVQTYATAEVGDVRLDYANNTGPDARGFGVAAGAEYKRLEVDTDFTNTTNLAGGDYSGYLYEPGFVYPRSRHSLPFFDYDQFAANGGWSSLGVNRTASLYSSLASDFEYVEKVKNAYLSLHYATDGVEAVLGVRHDDVDFTAHTPAITSGMVTGLTTSKGGYDNPLPSLNVVGHLTDDINLRLSASRTVGRPIPSNIAQAEVVNCDSDGGDCTISRGNPDLKPERSTNLDVSVEKFFADGNGYASLAWFKKNIKDNIASVTSESIADNGQATTITTPQNLEDSKVQGVEFSLVSRNLELGAHRLDVMFNATHMDGEMTYAGSSGSRTIHQLSTQPRNIANLGLTWHLPWLDSSLTVTENYTGKHIFTIGANSWQDRGFRSRYTTDMNWTTRIDPRWSVSLSAANLFGEDQYQTVGDDYQTMRNHNNYGATYALHVTYDLN
jgi:iron complex outermembrane receptor protein